MTLWRGWAMFQAEMVINLICNERTIMNFQQSPTEIPLPNPSEYLSTLRDVTAC
ncbi:MAG: hypothetical protein ACI9RO_001394 [Alteromonas macleodii]|jgi:hypothetical protein